MILDIPYYTFDSPSTTASVSCYPATTSAPYTPLKRGDRVRIKNGYEGPGDVYYYLGKSAYSSDTVLVESDGHTWEFVADAIEPYPYSREERIERAIEDFEDRLSEEFPMATHTLVQSAECHALLFAILDAGV